MYATVDTLADRFGYTELAGIGVPDDKVVPTASALRTLIEAGDATPVWPEWVYEAEQDAAAGCKARCLFALQLATTTIDSYLTGKYSLPLSDEVVSASVLPILCCDLARELLYDDQASEEVKARANTARAMLKDFALGKLALSNGTTQVATAIMDVQIVNYTSLWNTEGY